MDCVLAPQTFIPNPKRLKDEAYYIPFINHLRCHLTIINKYDVRIISSDNYHFDTSYMYNEEFKCFKQLFNDILYQILTPLLEAGIVQESDSCCTINPDIANVHCTKIKENWLKLLNSIESMNFVIIIGFEDIGIDSVHINLIRKEIVQDKKKWYDLLNELTYWDKNLLEFAIDIKSNRESISIDKMYTFAKSFYDSIQGCDEKTKRNILTTLIDALHTQYHRAEKVRGKDKEYRKDCNNDYRIHYIDNDGKIVFLHYDKHDVGIN